MSVSRHSSTTCRRGCQWNGLESAPRHDIPVGARGISHVDVARVQWLRDTSGVPWEHVYRDAEVVRLLQHLSSVKRGGIMVVGNEERAVLIWWLLDARDHRGVQPQFARSCEVVRAWG